MLTKEEKELRLERAVNIIKKDFHNFPQKFGFLEITIMNLLPKEKELLKPLFQELWDTYIKECYDEDGKKIH